MEKSKKNWQLVYAIGMAGLGTHCLVYQDFIVGRPPAWPVGVEVNPLLAYISGTALIFAAIAIVLNKKETIAALVIAGLIFLLTLALRHLPNLMVDWVNTYKSLALAGGALIVAGASDGNSLSENVKKNLLMIGSICVTAFFVAAGYAHFKWANGVQSLIPAFIPFRLFWTYFCGVCLVAGGIGILIPPIRKLAALLSGIMITGFFFLFHIPRFLADVHDKSDRLGVFESFAIAGIFFVLAQEFSLSKKRI
ncbi:MAG: hypothetical protein ACOYXT_26405 [Bacteroidota bacterium]